MHPLVPGKDFSSSISLSVCNNNYTRYAKHGESPPKSFPVKRSQTFPKSLSLPTMLNIGWVAKTPSDVVESISDPLNQVSSISDPLKHLASIMCIN